jgi:hypothetical protein
LKNLKQEHGIEEFEPLSLQLYSRQVEDIIGFKFIEEEKVREVLDYFHLKNIPVSSIEFIE